MGDGGEGVLAGGHSGFIAPRLILSKGILRIEGIFDDVSAGLSGEPNRGYLGCVH